MTHDILIEDVEGFGRRGVLRWDPAAGRVSGHLADRMQRMLARAEAAGEVESPAGVFPAPDPFHDPADFLAVLAVLADFGRVTLPPALDWGLIKRPAVNDIPPAAVS